MFNVKKINKLVGNMNAYDKKELPKLLQKLFMTDEPSFREDNLRQGVFYRLEKEYYTFQPKAVNKSFSFFRSIIYWQLFKYLHKQVHFNDLIRKAFKIHESDVRKLMFLYEKLVRENADLKKEVERLKEESSRFNQTSPKVEVL